MSHEDTLLLLACRHCKRPLPPADTVAIPRNFTARESQMPKTRCMLTSSDQTQTQQEQQSEVGDIAEHTGPQQQLQQRD